MDDAVVRRLLRACGHEAGAIHVKNGKAGVLSKLGGYNAAAALGPWIVLVDLNGDENCAPSFVARWMANPAPHMNFRVAVRQAEAWLLADRQRFAQFIAVRQAQIPVDPDAVQDAKQRVVDLAQQSSRRGVREDLCPSSGSGRRVGPGYVPRMIEFVESVWVPEEAAARSDSLSRCLRCLASLDTPS